MPRKKTKGISQAAGWLLAFFGALFVSVCAYLILLSLNKNFEEQKELTNKKYQEKFKTKEEEDKDLSKAEEQKDTVVEESKQTKSGSSYWSYQGETGPTEWASLSADYVLCKHGTKQSPIDLVEASTTPSLPSIKFNYIKEELNLLNDGKSLLIEFGKSKSHIVFKKKKYNLNKLSFHTPSEHHVEGAPHDMELQFHHTSKEGKHLNLSVMVDAIGSTNKIISKLWSDLPYGAMSNGPSYRFNPDELLPNKRRYYTYNGSMTVPPCTENMTWVIVQSPITISIRQLDKFRTIIKQNTRPLQKRNNMKLRISRSF